MFSVKNALLNLIKITELTASDDCDDVLKTGLYYIGAAGTLPSNYPTSATYSLMFCWMRGALGYQLILHRGWHFYIRKRAGNPVTWEGWTFWDNYKHSGTITYKSGWGTYSSQPLTLRRRGDVVTLFGAFTSTTSTATIGATAIIVATIPSDYRPPVRTVSLIQCSGSDIAAVGITPNGDFTIERLRAMNSTSYKAATSGYWFPVNMAWIVN